MAQVFGLPAGGNEAQDEFQQTNSSFEQTPEGTVKYTSNQFYNPENNSTFELLVGGNKINDNQFENSPAKSPIIGGMRGIGSSQIFDLEGNLFLSLLNNFNLICKAYVSTLESKTETIENDNTITALKQIITATETINLTALDIDLNGSKSVSINSEKINLNSPEIVLGSIISSEVGENEDEDVKKLKLNPDGIMTVGKFVYFYNKNIKPLFKMLDNLTTKYNSHTHGMNPTPLPQERINLQAGKYDKAIAVSELNSSSSIKVY